jgi:hypothetical protein
MDEKPILDVHLREFDKIKVEQFARISFRDNLIYATLVTYGAIVAFAVKDNKLALLILPWVSLILGWNYLVNDEKVSAIGRYVRITLSSKIASLLNANSDDLLGWEVAHRSDPRRFRRKLQQLIIDEVIFVFSGIVALVAFWMIVPDPGWLLQGVAVFEFIMLIVLAVEIVLYADLKSGR